VTGSQIAFVAMLAGLGAFTCTTTTAETVIPATIPQPVPSVAQKLGRPPSAQIQTQYPKQTANLEKLNREREQRV